jgi:hypothetical protein
MKAKLALLAGQSGIGATWRAVGGGYELGVAASAEAALRDEHALVVSGEVRDLRELLSRALVHDGTDGNGQLDGVALRSGAVRSFAVAPAAGAERFLEAVIEERVEIGLGDEVHRPAIAAIAAVRSAARDELLAPEADTPAAAMAGGNVDVYFVDKRHDCRLPTVDADLLVLDRMDADDATA